jgi:hypothetical protein
MLLRDFFFVVEGMLLRDSLASVLIICLFFTFDNPVLFKKIIFDENYYYKS